jgi:hypothetical protein
MICIHLDQFSLIVDLIVAVGLSLNETSGLILHAFESAEASELSLGYCSLEKLHFIFHKLDFQLSDVTLLPQAI